MCSGADSKHLEVCGAWYLIGPYIFTALKLRELALLSRHRPKSYAGLVSTGSPKLTESTPLVAALMSRASIATISPAIYDDLGAWVGASAKPHSSPTIGFKIDHAPRA